MAGSARPAPRTFAEALAASPGPDTMRQAVGVGLKGFCMGAADIIPGVSGGTMALITGIYDQLVEAIRSFDLDFVRRLLRLDVKGALASVHLRFLLPLLVGILTAVISLARVMHYLMNTHPVAVWSLFFGLIGASILVVGRRLLPLTTGRLIMAAAGAILSYLLVGMIPVSTPEALWFVFLCGAVAICAMILPGISGAFILLILGKYEFVTATLKAPFVGDNLVVLLTFAAGCALGIVSFSRVLHFFLSRHHGLTLSVLTGFMIGAMRKIWPWKEVLRTEIIRGKEYVLEAQNVLPNEFDATFFVALGLMVAGFGAVVALERLGTRVGSS